VSVRVVGEHDLRRRLLTDPRMEQVWRTLAIEGRKRERKLEIERKSKLNNLKWYEEEDPFAFLPEAYRMETWDAPTLRPLAANPAPEELEAPGRIGDTALFEYKSRQASFADRLCAAFFLATTIIFTVKNRTVRKYDIEREVRRWRAGASLCREALYSPHRAPIDPALHKALSASGAYFEEWAKFIETTSLNSPYLIERGSRNRAPGGSSDTFGDDAIRGQVRALAEATRQIFGTILYRTVARAASVATGESISPKSVQNWCGDLPRSPRNEFRS